MKQLFAILIFSLLMACNDNTKKEPTNKSSDSNAKLVKQEESKPMKSGDYSSLLTNFKCEMDMAEVAKVLEVPVTDLSIPEFPYPKKCHFNLKGFGQNSEGDGTNIRWGTVRSSKKRNKKEINNYLKNQKKYAANPKVYQNMSIVLADTKDSYIAHQPTHGRLIIYNENYDNAFMINYDQKGAFNRTSEQHEEIKNRMTNLANYLLKKHKK